MKMKRFEPRSEQVLQKKKKIYRKLKFRLVVFLFFDGISGKKERTRWGSFKVEKK